MCQFVHPFTACVAAPSGSGKSTFVLKFLQHLPELVCGRIDHVAWCFGQEEALPSEIINNPLVKTYRGVPTQESGVFKPNTLLILDDLMTTCLNDSSISDLYTKGSRHRKISVIILSQNLLYQSKHARNISLCTRYFILLRNLREKSQFQHLARQIYPENARSLCAALNEVWSQPFSYLVIDLEPSTPEALRFRTNIWPTDPYLIIYASDKSIEQYHESGATLQTYPANNLFK